MKAHPVSVNSEWTVAQTRTHLRAINSKSFFVTHQDGYLSGIVLPEWLDEIPDKKIRYVPMSTVARPISWVNAVRKSDTALTALKHMDLLRSNYLAVTDLNENLVGVITRENIASVIDGDQSAAWLCTSVRKPHEEIEY
jgi:Mg/Co/Ni transporter MgtE